MKQSLKDKFIVAAKKWDSVHAIIGHTKLEDLLDQNDEAINSLPADVVSHETMVDVGAGSGLLGLSWLIRVETNKVVFVELRKKNAAFLSSFFLVNCPGRVKILNKRIEAVTLDEINSYSKSFYCAARAFSGDKTLEEAFFSSELAPRGVFRFFCEQAIDKSEKYSFNKLQGR